MKRKEKKILTGWIIVSNVSYLVATYQYLNHSRAFLSFVGRVSEKGDLPHGELVGDGEGRKRGRLTE